MRRIPLFAGLIAFSAYGWLSAEPVVTSTETPAVETSGSDIITIDKVTIDDAGSRVLVLVQTSKPVQAFIFERKDPPSLFLQFLSTGVYATGAPIQVVGIDPLVELRYGYANFQDAATAREDSDRPSLVDYIELRLSRPVFYHVQQEGWVVVLGLDRTTAKVEVPDLDFRFEPARYEGAANLPDNPRDDDYVQVALANSRLLTVARKEADLARARVFEAQRSLYPQVTGRISTVKGEENSPSSFQVLDGFEGTTFRREEYGVQVTHPIWQSGRLWGAFRQSQLNRQMAIENVRKQAQDLTYEVKKAYITLLKNQSIIRIRRELVAQGQIVQDMVRQKQRLDLTSRSEVLNVTAQADQASYQLIGDDQDRHLSRLVLMSLLNQSNNMADPLPGELSFGRLSFNIESIIAWAQEHRPDVRIAKLNTELARYNWRAARAENNVKLDATGFYGRAAAAFSEDPFEFQDAWNVGVRMSKSFWGNTLRGSYGQEQSAPDLGQFFFTRSHQTSLELGLLDSLPGRSEARHAQLNFERAQAELVEVSRKAEYEVRETYYNLEKASRQLEALKQDVDFRQKDLEITREKTRLGLAELSQLMAAEVAYAHARVTEQDALAAYNVALASMDRVAGAEVVRRQ